MTQTGNRGGKLTIFLTGATGFVGSHLASQLLAEGHRLILLVRPQDGSPFERARGTIESASQPTQLPASVWEEVRVMTGDITQPHLGLKDAEVQLAREQTDIVFHCAASVSFEKRKDAIERCNLLGTRHVVDFLGLIGHPQFHYVSTAYVAGCRDGNVLEEELVRGRGFNNWYEETKFSAEQVVWGYRAHHPSTTIYRPSVIVGRLADGATNGFAGFYGFLAMVDAFFRQVQARTKQAVLLKRFVGVAQRDGFWHIPMRVPGRLDKTLNLVPIDFVVAGMLTIFHDESAHGKTYHLVNPSPPTIGELKEVVEDLYRVSAVQFTDPQEFSRVRHSLLESLFLAAAGRYLFYLQNPEPTFDDRNARRVFEKTGLKCPRFDRLAIERIIEFARRSSWGRQRP